MRHDHEIGIRPHDVKHFNHPEVGALELTCQRLVDPGQAHSLLVYTATPGSESYEKLQVLSVIEHRRSAKPLGTRTAARRQRRRFPADRRSF
ncbi:hypothetical protein [Nonomuraea insulae]|uniref:MmyB-like transcription regulator ligand binding domain-containing protein n=1 Tax=Nonomuraea insulae TaxID=1616787 RepID=A0ABW1CGC1_9ACTN